MVVVGRLVGVVRAAGDADVVDVVYVAVDLKTWEVIVLSVVVMRVSFGVSVLIVRFSSRVVPLIPSLTVVSSDVILLFWVLSVWSSLFVVSKSNVGLVLPFSVAGCLPTVNLFLIELLVVTCPRVVLPSHRVVEIESETPVTSVVTSLAVVLAFQMVERSV